MAKQPIAYWGTTIDPAKTANEILQMLVEYRACETSITWDSSGQPIAVRFTIEDAKRGKIPVRLEARVDDVFKYIRRQKPNHDNAKLLMQSRRIAWRHIKDLLEQQLLSVRIGQHTMLEAFFHMVEIETAEGPGTLGQWMGEAMIHGNFQRAPGGVLQLPAPRVES